MPPYDWQKYDLRFCCIGSCWLYVFSSYHDYYHRRKFICHDAINLVLKARLVMVWLNAWIKELILIILLAAFTDLLLPNHALQRYVRTVIGLFILLVLLSPIYELFHHRWSPEQWTKAVLADTVANETQMQPLSEIVKRSNQLKEANQKQAKLILEQQLEVSMKAGIESQNHVSVKHLQVSTRMDDNGKPSIEQVQVVLAEEKQAMKANAVPDQSPKPFISAMKPVSPVTIDLHSDAGHTSETVNSTVNEPLNPLHDQVKQYIAHEWQIKMNQIHVS
jgi:stage III sporulation protein AF